MNRLAVWAIFARLWWKIEDRSDELLHRYARIYWASVDNLIKFGIFATFAFLVFATVLALGDTCSLFGCEPRIIALLNAPANEIGDTLAGLAGGLAFLWLVVTVLLQGKELRLTRLEMVEQRKASQEMAVAMAKQSRVAAEQISYIQQQNERGRQTQAAEVFDNLLEQANEILQHSVWKRVRWLASEQYCGETKVKELNLNIFDEFYVNSEVEPVARLYPKLIELSFDLRTSDLVPSELPPRYTKFRQLLETLEAVDALKQDLPPDRLAKLRAIKFRRVLEVLKEIDDDKYWTAISRRVRKS